MSVKDCLSSILKTNDSGRLCELFAQPNVRTEDDDVSIVVQAWRYDRTKAESPTTLNSHSMIGAVFLGSMKRNPEDDKNNSSESSHSSKSSLNPLDYSSTLMVRAALRLDDVALMAIVWTVNPNFKLNGLFKYGEHAHRRRLQTHYDHKMFADFMIRMGAPSCAVWYLRQNYPSKR